MNRKYEIGDTVRIRDWEDMASEYGTDDDGDIPINGRIWFGDAMRYLCGSEIVIERFEDDEHTLIGIPDEDGDFDSGWTLSLEMVEPVPSRDPDCDSDTEDFVREYMSVLFCGSAG